MNLDFRTIGKAKREGVEYLVQTVDVTGNGRFWAAWKYAESTRDAALRLGADPPQLPLLDHIRVQRALSSDGRVQWAACRLLPVDGGLPLCKFSDTYTLRDIRGLLPFQHKAVRFLCNSVIAHNAAADGSDCGIGKTYHALGVCRNLILRPGIICKLAGISGWTKACLEMGVEPLFVTNWEQAKSGKLKYVKKRHLRYQWDIPRDTILIFDEAHAGACPGTQNNRLWLAAKGLTHLSLSATFSDRPSRLSSLLWLLDAIKDRDDYEVWLSRRGHFVNRYDKLEGVDERQDMLAINRLLYPRYGARLSYSDPEVKKWFPEAVYQTEVITMTKKATEEQNRLYKEVIDRIETLRAMGKSAEALNADLRYRQAAELLKAPSVAAMARNYMDQGMSVLIFVNFRETMAFLARLLNTRSLIFGDQDRLNVDRDEVISDFQANRSRVIILMEQAGGQSISLHDIHGGHPRLSLIFPTYDPVVLMQVLGRTYRAKARSTPVMKLVYAANTVEEKVALAVNRKLDNIAALNEGDLMEPDLFKLEV